MPKLYLLIDGYNLLHASGLARSRYGPGELEKCRERLLNLLTSRLTDDERSRTNVVFDGRDPWIDGPRSHVRQGMTIEFAPPDSDADTVIEQAIARHSAPRQLVVVSSDRRLKTAIARRRGEARTSEDFAAELDRRPRSAPEPAGGAVPEEIDLKQGAAATSDEQAHWEQVFADVQPEIDAAQQHATPRTNAARGKRKRRHD